MSRRVEMLRLTPDALAAELAAAGLTLRTFSRTFDVGYDQARRWLLPEGHPRAVEPPYWVLPMLRLCQLPGALNLAIELSIENRATEGDSHAA